MAGDDALAITVLAAFIGAVLIVVLATEIYYSDWCKRLCGRYETL